jgi:hypothetical protein
MIYFFSRLDLEAADETKKQNELKLTGRDNHHQNPYRRHRHCRRYTISSLEDLKQFRKLENEPMSKAQLEQQSFVINQQHASLFQATTNETINNTNTKANIANTNSTNKSILKQNSRFLSQFSSSNFPISMVKFNLPYGGQLVSKLKRSCSDTDFFRQKTQLNILKTNNDQNNFSLNLHKFFLAMDVNSENTQNTSGLESSKQDKLEQMESEWIESGKTKFGIQFERYLMFPLSE